MMYASSNNRASTPTQQNEEPVAPNTGHRSASANSVTRSGRSQSPKAQNFSPQRDINNDSPSQQNNIPTNGSKSRRYNDNSRSNQSPRYYQSDNPSNNDHHNRSHRNPSDNIQNNRNQYQNPGNHPTRYRSTSPPPFSRNGPSNKYNNDNYPHSNARDSSRLQQTNYRRRDNYDDNKFERDNSQSRFRNSHSNNGPVNGYGIHRSNGVNGAPNNPHYGNGGYYKKNHSNFREDFSPRRGGSPRHYNGAPYHGSSRPNRNNSRSTSPRRGSGVRDHPHGNNTYPFYGSRSQFSNNKIGSHSSTGSAYREDYNDKREKYSRSNRPSERYPVDSGRYVDRERSISPALQKRAFIAHRGSYSKGSEHHIQHSSRGPPGEYGSYSNRHKRHRREGEEAKPCNTLGFFGLDSAMRENDIRNAVMKYAEPLKITLIYDRNTHESRGFAFVVFKSVEEATHVKSRMASSTILGRFFRTDFSLTTSPDENQRHERSPRRENSEKERTEVVE